jgi:hypothetical protein
MTVPDSSQKISQTQNATCTVSKVDWPQLIRIKPDVVPISAVRS